MHDDIAMPDHAHAHMATDLALIHDLLGGTSAMRRAGGKWLPREEAESWQAWQARLHRSVLFNGIGRLVQLLVGKPFAKAVTLSDAHPTIHAFAMNIDGKQTSLTSFARHLLTHLLTDGQVHIQLDRPVSGGAVYAICRPTLQLIGARCDPSGSLSQIRLKDTRICAKGRYGAAAEGHITLLTTTGWEQWHQPSGEGGKWVKQDEGAHDFGAVPFLTLAAHPTGFMTARPPLLDMAWLNLAHWQSASDQRHILHIARVPLLFGRNLQVPETGLDIGPNRLILSDDPSADLRFVEHSGAAIEAGRQDLRDLEERMAILGLDLIARRPGHMTATAKAIDAAQAHAALTSLITVLQQGLQEMLIAAARWYGLDAAAAGTLRLSQSHLLPDDSSAHASWLLAAHQAGAISHDEFRTEARRYGLLDGGMPPSSPSHPDTDKRTN